MSNLARVILNADDFGLCAPVNAAIIAAHRAGNLSSTTCMVNMPGTAEAAALAAAHPALAIGLHFCLTEGRPLTGTSALTDAEGGFLPRGSLLRQLLLGRVPAKAIRAEFEAQLARLRALGMRPTHTDSHQHIHMNPVVFRALLPVLRAERLPARLAEPARPPLRLLRSWPQRFLSQTILYRASRRYRPQLNTPTNARLVSVHDLRAPAAALDAAALRALVGDEPAGSVVELMVHPYLPGPALDALYPNDLAARQPFFEKCYAEHRILSGPPLFAPETLTTYAEFT